MCFSRKLREISGKTYAFGIFNEKLLLNMFESFRNDCGNVFEGPARRFVLRHWRKAGKSRSFEDVGVWGIPGTAQTWDRPKKKMMGMFCEKWWKRAVPEQRPNNARTILRPKKQTKKKDWKTTLPEQCPNNARTTPEQAPNKTRSNHLQTLTKDRGPHPAWPLHPLVTKKAQSKTKSMSNKMKCREILYKEGLNLLFLKSTQNFLAFALKQSWKRHRRMKMTILWLQGWFKDRAAKWPIWNSPNLEVHIGRTESQMRHSFFWYRSQAQPLCAVTGLPATLITFPQKSLPQLRAHPLLAGLPAAADGFF